MASSAFPRGLTSGDTVVVTGAGQGIGRAIAIDLAAHQVNLVLWDIDREKCEHTAADCRNDGSDVLAMQVDVSVPEEIAAATRETLGKRDSVYGIVNNAGIFPRAGLLEATAELWLRVFKTNLLSCVLVSQGFIPGMIERGRGAIVNLGSGRSVQGAVRGAHYAASKAGVVSLTKSMALELAASGIRVNCLIPGLTETAQPLEDYSVEALHSLAKRVVPMERVGQPEDMAGAVRFMLGDDARFMTGQSIAINGGMIMLP